MLIYFFEKVGKGRGVGKPFRDGLKFRKLILTFYQKVSKRVGGYQAPFQTPVTFEAGRDWFRIGVDLKGVGGRT